MSFPKQWCPSYWINSTQVAQKPHTHSSQPLSESLRYTVKLAKRLQTIMFHYNDISRNKEDYTLIKQWNYAGNHDDGCKFNNILYSWKVFFFFFFLLPERLEKLWARTEKRLCLIWTLIPSGMSRACLERPKTDFTANWSAHPGSRLHIYLEKWSKSRKPTVPCLQMTVVSKVFLQVRSNFIFFLKYISLFESLQKQLAYS